jgi:hypothetical protein
MNNEQVAWTQNTFCKYCHRIPSQCCCTPAKTLTDEEIDQTITDCGYEIEKTVMGKFVDIEGINMYNSLCGFARAILKKAQEK